MPFAFSWSPKGVHARFWGRCTIDDLVGCFTKLGNDPRLDDIAFAIFDYLDIEHQNLRMLEVEEAAAIDIAWAFTHPRILFASISNDGEIRKLWNHFVSLNSHPERHALVGSLEEAYSWIADQQGRLGSMQRLRGSMRL